MNRVLITGCNGFIGANLAEFLVKKGLLVSGIVHHNSERTTHFNDKVELHQCDILEKQKLQTILTDIRPELIFHLAAKSKVMPSWQNPELTFQINLLGTLYLLDAVRKICSNSVVIVVEAASIYGSSSDETPMTEDQKYSPSSPYAVSKVAQDYLAVLYESAYNLNIIRVRPFNITGPGNLGDACSDFARGIVAIERGYAESLKVGDLDSVRDITDVRDAVTAFKLIAEKGLTGSVYNLCSSKGYKMKLLVEHLIDLSKVRVEVIQDISKKRLLKDNFQIGDNSKLTQLGWQPTISISKTLSDMLDYWRSTNKADFSMFLES